MIKNNLTTKNNLIFLFINYDKTIKKYFSFKLSSKLYFKKPNLLDLYTYFYNFFKKKFLFFKFLINNKFNKKLKVLFFLKNKNFPLKNFEYYNLNLFYKKWIFYKINSNTPNYLNSKNNNIFKNIKSYFIYYNSSKNYFFKNSTDFNFIFKGLNKIGFINFLKFNKSLLKFLKSDMIYLFYKKNLFFNFFNLNLFFNLTSIKNNNKSFIWYQNFYIKTNKIIFIKYLIALKDFFLYNFKSKFKINFNSNNYLNNFYNFSDSQLNIFLNSKLIFNNYYPIVLVNNKKLNNSFYSLFRKNNNNNYLYLTNKIFINFFEKFLKKNIYMRVVNNFFFKIKDENFIKFLHEYKNYQPLYFKNFIFSDFLEIIWYSFKLKDLNLLSQWITKFMETLNFKNHKKFIMFFQNFIYKNSGLFINDLKIKGFFFDIRGKVGVTGSSKKRHISFKFGSLGKSTKKFKINLNQNLVRTYSGVLGLTYIICY